MNTTCKYCNHTFKNLKAYEKHKNRITACISWEEVDNAYLNYENELKRLKINFDKSITSLQDMRNTLNLSNNSIKDYEKIINEQKTQISDLMAKLLINEDGIEVKWNNITIIAPFMSTNSKKSIKNAIVNIESIDEIKTYITTTYPHVTIEKIITKKKNIEIILENPEITECKICFSNKVQRKSKCKICKCCYICEECEYDQMKKYNRCAFCNTVYT